MPDLKKQAPLTLHALNTAALPELVQRLGGLYEHSPWIPTTALKQRPFTDFSQFQEAMVAALTAADVVAQLALVRAHPLLVGKPGQALTKESKSEQSTAGLNHCSPEELQIIQTMNQQYLEKFGWPFILAVRGPTGLGLTRHEIIGTFSQRLENDAATEFALCLRNIHQIAAWRLRDLCAVAG